MNMWDILEIKPTEDTSIIKKAYAKKLKIYHPEDNPQGFQKLREAYDAALKYSKNKIKRTLIITHEDDISESFSVDHSKEELHTPPIINLLGDFIPDAPNKNFHTPPPIKLLGDFIPEPSNKYLHTPPSINLLEDFIPEVISIEALNSEFIKKIKILYNNLFTRIDIENWKPILDCNVMWDISNRKDINIKMLEFLADHRHLPQNVWKLLDLNFNFSEMENSFNSPFAWLIKYIVKQLTQNPCLDFSNFKDINGFDYEDFFGYRQQTLDALAENKLKDAKRYISLAKKIYAEDPDLLRMEVQYYVRIGSPFDALPILDHLLSLKPQDIAGLFYRGKIYYDMSKITLAVEDYLKIQALMPENQELPSLMANCYMKLGAFEEAKEYFEKLLLLTPSNNSLKSYLTMVNKQIKYKLILDIKRNPGNKTLKLKLAAIKKEIKYENKLNKIPISKWKLAYIAFICSILLLVIYVGFKVSNTPTARIIQPTTVTDDIPNNINTKTTTANTIDLNTVGIYEIPDGVQNVKGTFTNVTCLNQFIEEEKDKISVIFIGTINGNDILFTTNILLASTYKNTKQLDFKGKIIYGPSSQIQSSVREELKKLNLPTDNLVPIKYVSIEDETDLINLDTTKTSHNSSSSLAFLAPLCFFIIAMVRRRSK